MSDIKPAWDEVADSVTELGKLLKAHFDEVISERDAGHKAPDDAGHVDGAGHKAPDDAGHVDDAGHKAADDAGRKRLDDAFAQLRVTLDRAYSAAGHAAKDPAVRENATKVGSSFVEALSTTFTEVGQRLKSRGH